MDTHLDKKRVVPTAVVAGLFLVVVGAIAVVTGEFLFAGTWVLALGLAVVGVTGLIGALTTKLSTD